MIHQILIHNDPSKGESELLDRKERFFQKDQIRKRKSLWALSWIDTQAWSSNLFSINSHLSRVELSIILRTLIIWYEINIFSYRSWPKYQSHEKRSFIFKRHIIHQLLGHYDPSEGESELLTQREQFFQKVQIRKR